MRLVDFILENIEPILTDWENYARSIWPGTVADPVTLRDHAEEMLIAVANDMRTDQSLEQQAAKSRGDRCESTDSGKMDGASVQHALGRIESGFDLRDLVAEYRALRASVIRLWQQAVPEPGPQGVADLIRFNEGIDQLLATSILSYTESIARSRELFLGILGHDLRNPLSAMAMLSHMLTRREELEEPSRRMVSQMAQHTEEMRGMVEDLLEFATIRWSGKLAVYPEAMDLLPLCCELLDEMKAVYPEREFVFEHQGDLRGEWDRARLRQLLSNLLANAAQHGGANAPVIFEAGPSGSEVCLSVRNRGNPIPKDQLSSLFDPYKKTRRSRSSSRSEGAGLGLFIAREVAAAHQGRIQVHSSEDITEFSVHLPRRAVPA